MRKTKAELQAEAEYYLGYLNGLMRAQTYLLNDLPIFDVIAEAQECFDDVNCELASFESARAKKR